MCAGEQAIASLLLYSVSGDQCSRLKNPLTFFRLVYIPFKIMKAGLRGTRLHLEIRNPFFACGGIEKGSEYAREQQKGSVRTTVAPFWAGP